MSAPVPSAEPKALRLIATLGIAGLLSGLALVGIYELTLPTITANRARALREAVFQVVPGASSMQKLTGDPLAVSEEGEGVFAAYDDAGDLLGYAIPSEGSGFQDKISILYGFDPGERVIVGMAVLESRETPGLGDKIYKDDAFQENFEALAVEPQVVAVKKGEKSAPNQVDCITGATISSKAVVAIINAGNERWLGALPASGNEPPAPAPQGDDDVQ